MPSKGRVRQAKRSREQWLAVIAEHAASGQTAREFCESRGLSVSTFCNARRRAKPAPVDGERSVGGEFVEVAVDAVRTEDLAAGRWDIELNLGSGVVLRIRST